MTQVSAVCSVGMSGGQAFALRLTRTFVVGLALVVNLLGVCCHKSTAPAPGRYYLYAGVNGAGVGGLGYVAIIDCTADSIIDSFRFVVRETYDIAASPEGRFLAIKWQYIYDLATLTQKTWIREPFIGRVFLPNVNLFLGPTFDSTVLYSMPSFERIGALPVEVLNATAIPGTNTVIGIDSRPSSEVPGGMDQSRMLVFDYVKREVIDTVVISPGSTGEGVHITLVPISISSDGQRLYVEGFTRSGYVGDEIGRGGNFVIGFDLSDRRVLFARELRNTWGFCRVSPDGRELWYTELGTAWPHPTPPYIHMVDALTGSSIDSVSLMGLYPDTVANHQNRWMEPRDIRFLPDGSKAYVSCGGYGAGSANREPILVFDTRSREITKMIFEDFAHSIVSIDLAPAL